MRSVARFRVDDPAAAVAAAVDDGTVLPFENPLPDEDPSLPELSGAGQDAAGRGSGRQTVSQDAGIAPARPRTAASVGPAEDAPGTGRCLLALARYALAEEAVAEGLARLAATAEPLSGPGGDDGEAAAGERGQAAAESAAKATDRDRTSGTVSAGGAEGSGEVIELDEAQRGAVAAVAGHGVSVLAGGPGTGKSRTVAAVVALAAERGLRVALAAPTGRAAKRLEELAGAPATTLHRLLGAQGRSRGDGPTTGRPGRRARPGSSPGARNGRWTPTWWSWTSPRCWTPSWPPRWSRRARTAPGCCWWATRPSCPRSAPAGCSPTSSTPAPCRSPS